MDIKKYSLAVESLLYNIEKFSSEKTPVFAETNSELLKISAVAAEISAFSKNNKFTQAKACKSIFNRLNGNNSDFVYTPTALSGKSGEAINYPLPQAEINSDYKDVFSKLSDEISAVLKDAKPTVQTVNTLAETLETYASFIPSPVDGNNDISLYEHSRMTAAISLCIYDFLVQNNKSFEISSEFFAEKAFLLFSADTSGIQDFIYNISSKGALKGLRARSFYLDIALESAVDELLDRLGLIRANVLYTGGGHTYMILPNTKQVKTVLADFETELNNWFLENFTTRLYMGTGFCEASANDFLNNPSGSYSALFKSISRIISEKKLRRYNAEQLIKLNFSEKDEDHHRECSICNRSDRLIKSKDGGDICEICHALRSLSDDILDGSIFSVLAEKPTQTNAVILPFNRWLAAGNDNKIGLVRSYSKNMRALDNSACSRLWAADYCAEKEFSKLVKNAKGIDRLCVLRADVDNLGQAFVSGFDTDLMSISRTAELSRKLSVFFKHNINFIMQNPVFSLDGNPPQKRNAAIIYAGGDDVFIAGGWNDVIGFAIDLNNAFRKYTQKTLSISAGIGMYKEKFPLYAMAEHSGRLEEFSKSMPAKNSLTLFDESNCYGWSEFKHKVVGEKLRTIQNFLKSNSEKGSAMLYNMLELIRSRQEDRLNIARFAYVCARLAEALEENDKSLETSDFTKKMYGWIQSDDDRKQLITAIYLYVYLNRNSDKNRDEEAKYAI